MEYTLKNLEILARIDAEKHLYIHAQTDGGIPARTLARAKSICYMRAHEYFVRHGEDEYPGQYGFRKLAFFLGHNAADQALSDFCHENTCGM